MKDSSVDLIQVFCSNFDCDIDLRYPPGVVKRFKNSVKWPDLASTNLFSDLSEYDRKMQLHRLEIHLKRSRYSLEVLNLVLSSKESLPHLEDAIRSHYLKTDSADNFHPEMIALGLKGLKMLPSSLDDATASDSALQKYEKWLRLAADKVSLDA